MHSRRHGVYRLLVAHLLLISGVAAAACGQCLGSWKVLAAGLATALVGGVYYGIIYLHRYLAHHASHQDAGQDQRPRAQ